jgi:cysteinyl-tRNA synthetase
MPIKLFNTLTRKKEVFKPLKNKRVGLYACGPTVYWYAHLGNLRTYIFEDILRRVLKYNGYRVRHVMNFTDVGHLTSDEDTGEDKVEASAKREGKTAKDIADFYIAAFKKDARLLNILEPTIYARATDHIKEQLELIKILEKNGFTYKIYDGVYFNTSRLKDYGQLAQLDLAGLKPGARVAQVSGKKNPTDFALWKLTPAGVKRQQEWDSPWGRGFPGWHLECSAMSRKYLGPQFDIHAGGVDHISVHHTNEIAQSEAAYGKIPARFWLHGEFLLVDDNKISKSLGNIITLDEIAEKFNPLAFRYLVLTAHYRSQLNLTWESLEASQTALNNLYQVVWDLKLGGKNFWLTKLLTKLGLAGKKIKNIIRTAKKYQEDFLEAVNDDLDTPKAVSLVWRLIDDKNILPAGKKKLLLQFDEILGFNLNKIKIISPPSKVRKLVELREKCRREKQWLKADKLRAQIEQEGWLLEDTAEGPKLKPKQINPAPFACPAPFPKTQRYY